MTAEQPATRRDRRAAAREAARRVPHRRAVLAAARTSRRIRATAFVVVSAVVVAGGVYLAAGDLFGQRGDPTTGGALPLRMSMAGFDPAIIPAKAGDAVSIDFWTTDAAPHLEGGVHTFISDELGLYETLAAAGPMGESRRTFTFTAPSLPGDYDIYCDTCCGGRQSPTMHGVIRVG